jgi:hypothetical protein
VKLRSGCLPLDPCSASSIHRAAAWNHCAAAWIRCAALQFIASPLLHVVLPPLLVALPPGLTSHHCFHSLSSLSSARCYVSVRRLTSGAVAVCIGREREISSGAVLLSNRRWFSSIQSALGLSSWLSAHPLSSRLFSSWRWLVGSARPWLIFFVVIKQICSAK